MFIVNNVFFFFKVYNAGDPIDGGDSMEDDDQDSYEKRLARLREKHGGGIADFKLKCWARMLVSSENITSTLKFHDI